MAVNAEVVIKSIDGTEKVPTMRSEGASAEMDLSPLREQAVRATRAYVFKAIGHAEAQCARAPAWADAEVASLRRHGQFVNQRLDDFIEAASRVACRLSQRPFRPHLAAIAKTPNDDQVERAPLRELTPREHHALELLVRGLQNKQIAHELGISESTAKAHISAIMRKLNVSNRSRVIALFANIDGAVKGTL